jgi:hypothetical protein
MFDFNQNQNGLQFLIRLTVSNFMRICPRVLKLYAQTVKVIYKALHKDNNVPNGWYKRKLYISSYQNIWHFDHTIIKNSQW